jgi:AraC-like DNA-binding protein
MRYTELPPPPALADVVHCFWFLTGDLHAPAEEQPVVADGRLEIILHLAEPFQVQHRDARWRGQADALMAGQLTAPIRVRPGGDTDVVGIRFHTVGARAVTNVPLAELGDRVVPLPEMAPALTEALLGALTRSQSPSQRVAALATVLVRHLRTTPDAAMRSVVHQLDRPHAPSIGRVADRLGFTARTIERRVVASTGLTPVELRAVLRFRRCYRMLEAAPTGHWGRVAYVAGYYDQAHCIREFRRFTGAAPTQWFGREPELASAFLVGKLKS